MNIVVGAGAGTTWAHYLLSNTINRSDTIYLDDESSLFGTGIMRSLYRLVNHRKTKKICRSIRPLFFGALIPEINSNTEYIVFLNWNSIAFDNRFIVNIRKKAPKCIIVLLLTATMQTSKIFLNRNGLDEQSAFKLFDKVCSFDYRDSVKYNFTYVPLMFNGVRKQGANVVYDVFYIGNAKDRLNYIHNLYARLTDNGVKCLFYVSGVPESEKKFETINYNVNLPYSKVLELSEKSRVILEVTEKDQTFSTIRLGESILLNRKFITNNFNLKNDDCFNKDYMRIIDTADDLISFIKSDIPADVHPSFNTLTDRELIKFLEQSH